MRFLMKTLRARAASPLIHAFRRNPLWIRSGGAPVSVSPAKSGLGHLVDWLTTNSAHRPFDFDSSSILLLKAAPKQHSLHQSHVAAVWNPIAHGTFPIRLSNVRVGSVQQSSKSPRPSSICNHTLARGDLLDSRFGSAPLEPVTRVLEPGIPIAMMPVVMMPVNVVIDDPVRLSVLAKR